MRPFQKSETNTCSTRAYQASLLPSYQTKHPGLLHIPIRLKLYCSGKPVIAISGSLCRLVE